MRHIVRYCLRGLILGLSGAAIAACANFSGGLSGFRDLPEIVEVTGKAEKAAARSEITGVNTVRMRVARKAMDNGDYDVAARFYRVVADAVPDNPAPLIGLGEAELAQGKLDDAETTFRAALIRAPNAADTNDALGRVLVSKGAFLEAIQHFRRAAAVAPSASLHNKLGVAHDLMGDGEAAQQHYRAALELDPEIVTARNNLALSLAISEQYSEAITHMEKVALQPDATPRHRQNLAFVYGMAGRLEDTERVLGRKDQPESEQARNQALFERIRSLAKAGDRSSVLAFLRSARPGASFADQMAGLPPAPAPASELAPEEPKQVAAMATPPASPRKNEGLRQDELNIPTPAPGGRSADAEPGTTAEPMTSSDMAEAPEPTGSPEAAEPAIPAGKPYEPMTVAKAQETPANAEQPTKAKAPLGSADTSPQDGNPAPASPATSETDMARLSPATEQPVTTSSQGGEADEPTAAVAMPSDSPYRIQLASYRTEATAVRGLNILKGMLGVHAAGLEIMVRQDRKAEARAIDYRIRTLPLVDRDAGTRLCAEIVAAGHPDCLVIRHNTALWQPVAVEQPAVAGAGVAPTYRIQLASYRSEKRALRGREILTKLLGEQVKELEVMVKRSHAEGSRSIDYTIRTSPLPTREDGDRLCDAIRAAGHPGCLVIRHNDSFWQLAGQAPDKRAAIEPRYRVRFASYRMPENAARERKRLRRLLIQDSANINLILKIYASTIRNTMHYRPQTAPVNDRATAAALRARARSVDHRDRLILSRPTTA